MGISTAGEEMTGIMLPLSTFAQVIDSMVNFLTKYDIWSMYVCSPYKRGLFTVQITTICAAYLACIDWE